MRVIPLILLLGGLLSAQPVLRLKGRVEGRSGKRQAEAVRQSGELKKWSPDRSHWILQFEREPAAGVMERLKSTGVEILGYIPDHALLVRAADAQDWSEYGAYAVDRLRAADKVSPTLDGAEGAAPLVIEFHPGVDVGAARQIATLEGLRLRDSADVLAQHLLAEGTAAQAWALAAWDEVAYVFPASTELTEGTPVRPCAGALTVAGRVGNLAARVGEGWDGPGANSAELTYSFGALTDLLPAAVVRAEVERALAEWARYADLRFTATLNPSAPRHIHFLFATGDHEDDYAFDGRGGGLAHAFFPAPPNPESIAGDLHFDGAEFWRVGNDTDVFSVALHELGHSLGLGHSDLPQSVMYAYYRRVSGLTDDDIASIRELYAARQGATPPPSVPPPPPFDPTPAPGNPTTPPAQPAPSPPPAPVPPPPPPPTVPPPSIPPITPGPGQPAIPPTTPGPVPPPPPPPTSPTTPTPAPQPGADRTAPSLTVQYPPTTSFTTTASVITVRGTAGDNTGVTQVAWSSNTAGGGAAAGTKQWAADSVPLLKGTNYIIVRAYDAAGNTAWRSIVVTRR